MQKKTSETIYLIVNVFFNLITYYTYYTLPYELAIGNANNAFFTKGLQYVVNVENVISKLIANWGLFCLFQWKCFSITSTVYCSLGLERTSWDVYKISIKWMKKDIKCTMKSELLTI